MTLDTTPLTAPVDPAELKEFTRRNPTRTGPDDGALGNVMMLLGVGGTAFALFAIFVGLVGESLEFTLLWGVLPLLGALLLAAGGWKSYSEAFERHRVFKYRTDMFARSNGLVNEWKEIDRDLPGVIFHRGKFRAAFPVLRRESGRFVEFANYRYSNQRGAKYHWGYVAIKLDTALPNIVLDALGNNGLWGQSNLPVTLGPEQRLSLEGEFDQYFALYCPEGYERDALYLFTPDIMARLIDNAARLDVEIVDDWLFLYGKRPLVTTDPATWTWLMTTVDAVTQKLDRWTRWRDDKLPETASDEPLPPLLTPPPVVAAGGRRLRQKRELLKGLLILAAFVGAYVLALVFLFSLGR
ncbi:hypothetical protein GCM10027058_15200 [Microbacterium neimengense]